MDVPQVEPAINQLEPVHLIGEPLADLMHGRRVEPKWIHLDGKDRVVLQRSAGFCAGGIDDGFEAVRCC